MGINSSKKRIDVGGKSYTVERLVGRGAFGKVYAIMTKEGELLALKQLSKRALLTKKAVQGTLREREFLSELEHPFLVNLRGSQQNHTHCMMILDFMKGGDLTFHLDRRPNHCFPEDAVRFYLANIILVLQMVHEHRLVHRDIKPDNILLDAKGYAYLTDFNVSRRLEIDDRVSGYAGTFAYMAPELFVKGARYGTKVDIWSLGIVMFRLLFGRVPWEYPPDRDTLDWLAANPEPNFRIDPRDEARQQTAKRILRGRVPIPSGMSHQASDLLQRMVAPADERFDVAQVKAHPWFSSIDWAAMMNKSLDAPFQPEEKANVDAALFVEDVFAGKTKEDPLTAEEQALFVNWNWSHYLWQKMEDDAIAAGTYKPKRRFKGNSLLRTYPKIRIMQERYLRSTGGTLSDQSAPAPATPTASSSSSAAPSAAQPPLPRDDDDYGIKPEPELGREVRAGDADLVAVAEISPGSIDHDSQSSSSSK